MEGGRLSGKANYSVKSNPISSLPINLDSPIVASVPPDMLHLRGRVGKKILDNCITISGEHTKNKLAPEFQALVRLARVPFKISESLVHGKSQIGSNTLTGRHWRIILKKLPNLIRQSTNCFPESCRDKIAQLFEDLDSILATAGKCEPDAARNIAASTSKWLKDFLELGKSGLKGFGNDDITPYIHWLHVHVPYFVSLYGGLDKFSGELLEAQNNEIKLTHARRTNFKDPKMTLKLEKRREIHLMEEEVEKQAQVPRKRKHLAQHPW